MHHACASDSSLGSSKQTVKRPLQDSSPSDTIVPPSGGDAHLLVIDGDVSRRHQLPGAGAVTIGRDSDCDLVLRDKSASRRHARIDVARHISVVDLESRNGTLVNNAAISGRRRLSAGDVVVIGDVVIIVHTRSPPRGNERIALAEADWRQRLAIEIERAGAYNRSVGVVAIDGAPGTSSAFADSLRSIDSVTEAEDGQILLLFPELDRRSVAAEARRVLESLSEGGEARAGYASFPCDGLDVDTLLLAARSVARQAPAGAVWTLAEVARRIELGEHRVVLADPAMIRQFELIERLAKSKLPILVIGATGAGKEVAAAAVHHFSERAGGPYQPINCANLQKDLLQSQLFGHVKGAFTDAREDRAGLFETASGGTLFLDEIGDLSLESQAELLRVVESNKVRRVGDTKERPIDVRLVAATNHDLGEAVAEGRFREDLYFRIGVATVLLPPLDQRRCEIPLLAREFLARYGKPDIDISPAVMRRLQAHDWPGSVRELQKTIEYAAAMAVDRERIVVADLPPNLQPKDEPVEPVIDEVPVEFRPIKDEVEALEKTRIRQALYAANGVKTRAAELISMPIRTFSAKLKQYGIEYRLDD
jgi:DNA-binding NtrC family response regulator/pSer/pThr/pTyr-binding forkhead associated (FHA) protein